MKFIVLNFFRTDANPTSGGEQCSLNLLRSLSSNGASVLSIYISLGIDKLNKEKLSGNINQIGLPATDFDKQIYLKIKEKFTEKVTLDVTLIWSAAANALLKNTIKENISEGTILISQHFCFGELLENFSNYHRILFSHNIESHLKKDAFKNRELIELFESKERHYSRMFDLVTSVSHNDKNVYVKKFGFDENKVIFNPHKSNFKVVEFNPNHQNNLNCFFLASHWKYNILGFSTLVQSCPAFFNRYFINVIGSISDKLKIEHNSKLNNVIYHGVLEEVELIALASKCAFAINPCLDGAGANVKNADYIALGLPILTTKFGLKSYENYQDYITTKEIAEWDSFDSTDLKNIPFDIRQSATNNFSADRFLKLIEKSH